MLPGARANVALISDATAIYRITESAVRDSEYVSVAEINGLVVAAILVRDPDAARDAARQVGRRFCVRWRQSVGLLRQQEPLAPKTVGSRHPPHEGEADESRTDQRDAGRLRYRAARARRIVDTTTRGGPPGHAPFSDRTDFTRINTGDSDRSPRVLDIRGLINLDRTPTALQTSQTGAPMARSYEKPLGLQVGESLKLHADIVPPGPAERERPCGCAARRLESPRPDEIAWNHRTGENA